MSNDLTGFITTKQAASLTGYTKDYVGQLARQGHIESVKQGRNRLVKTEDLFSYVSNKEAGEEKEVEASDDNDLATDDDLTNSGATPLEINLPQEVISKKIISPWIEHNSINDQVQPMMASNAATNYGGLNNASVSAANLPQKRPDWLPIISTSAVVLSALIFMFTISSTATLFAEKERLQSEYSVAAVGETSPKWEYLAHGWYLSVNKWFN